MRAAAALADHCHSWLLSSHLAVVVFNLTKPGNVLRAILGDQEVGTSISGGDKLAKQQPAAPEAAPAAAGAELSA
jgi:hypothetical protein